MPYTRTFKVFVAHGFDPLDGHYTRFKALLPGLQYMTVVDFGDASAKGGKAARMKLLTSQMEGATLVVALSDMYARHGEWLDAAVKAAKELRKPVLVVRPNLGGEAPAALAKAATEVIDYKGPKIGDAIKRLAWA
ncbi:MAG: hypothetical protein FJ317_08090 [SAR202 cluster bacterium]|nr:hypothetical protein [SAR202 cluster bacterium]